MFQRKTISNIYYHLLLAQVCSKKYEGVVPAVNHIPLKFSGEISHVKQDQDKLGAASQLQVHTAKVEKNCSYQEQTCRQDLWHTGVKI